MKAVGIFAALAATATLLGSETIARADERESCASAADTAQQSRDDGKYRRAREAMLICARDVCPAPIKRDCLEWLTQLETIAPTIVLAAKEGTKDLSDVKVYVDGALVTDKLDGKPLQMDLGKHKVRFDYAGQSKEEDVIIGAGQKNRNVLATFDAAAPPSTPPPPAKDQRGSLVPVFIVGGIGVVALGSFAIFGLSGKGEVDDLQACKGHCAQGDVDKARTKLVIADISLGVGIVALGVATYMFVTRPKIEADVKSGRASSSNTAVSFDVGALSGGAMGSLGGRF